jgi:parallel beta-helix repeat protein
MRKLFVIVFGLGMLFVPRTVFASTYYTSLGGSGSTCSEASPCSLSNGYAKLAGGDTLYLRGGTYTQPVSLNRSGTSSAPLTVMAYPGEHVKIAPTTSPSSTYDPALSISGSYNVVKNLEVTYPAAKGIQLSGSNNTLDGLDVHTVETIALMVDNEVGNTHYPEKCKYNTVLNSSFHEAQSSGIQVRCPHNTFIGNDVYHNVLFNDCPGGGGGCISNWPGNFSLDGPDGDASFTIVRNNNVHEGYAEGILGMSANNCTIEGNIVWDNLHENIYFDHSSNSTISNNFVYYTTNKEYWLQPEHPQCGIEFANEVDQPGTIGHDLKIYNNIIVNAGWGIASITSGKNMFIANNTVVINNSDGIAIDMDPAGASSGSVIVNNIFRGPVGNHDGFTFSNNFTNDPQFVGGGEFDPASYVLKSNSQAIDKGTTVNIANDFAGNSRPQGSGYDMGAYESGSGGGPTNTPIPTRTPTPTLSPSPKPTPSPTRTPTITPTPTPIPGDIWGPNNKPDGHVDMYDFNKMRESFGSPYSLFDYNDLVGNFGL